MVRRSGELIELVTETGVSDDRIADARNPGRRRHAHDEIADSGFTGAKTAPFERSL